MSIGIFAAAHITASGGGWSPPDFADLAYWFDAPDAATFTIAVGAVQQWNDKSPAGLHVSQAASGARPTRTATVGGLTAVAFDGTDDYLLRGDTATTQQVVNPTDGTWTAFVVASKTGNADYDVALSTVPAGLGGASYVGTYNAGYEIAGRDSATRVVAAGTAPTGTGVLIVARQRTTHLDLYVNGALLASTAMSGALSTAPTRLALGSHVYNVATAGFPWAGAIGQIVGYSRNLTDAELTTATTALKTRWSIT